MLNVEKPIDRKLEKVPWRKYYIFYPSLIYTHMVGISNVMIVCVNFDTIVSIEYLG